MPRRPLRRSSLLSRRLLAAVMIGVVVLLGVSACLTRGGADASSSAGVVVATTRSAADAPAKPVLRRCAFAIFAALPDRRELATPAVATAPPPWRLADAAAPEEWSGRVPERPPRPASLV